jgi:hypothetical protein
MLIRCFIVLALTAITLFPQHASAATYTYNFSGTWNSITPAVPYFSVGQTFTGSFSYNTPGSDSSPGTNFGSYATSGALNFSSGTVVANDRGTFTNFTVANNSPSDSIGMVNEIWAGPPYPPVYYADLHLVDTDGAVFSSDALPTAPFPLSSFETRRLHVVISHDGSLSNDAEAIGTITSLTFVPEPSACALLLLLAPALTRRRD